jgi:hypothetical protein
VLDLAAGTAELTGGLLPLVGRLIAVDPSTTGGRFLGAGG